MARLQILELPEGSNDDRPPFVLVVDQCVPQRIALGTNAPYRDYWQDLADKIGARGVIVTPETVGIPANDTTAYIQQAAEETGAAIGEAVRAANAQHSAGERTGIARDMDRLAKRKQELADALGIDRTRDWDDIRNAAAGLRKQCDSQAAELERLRAGEEPVTDERIAPTPAQWIWHWNRATPEKRLSMAAQIQAGMTRSNNCFMNDHDAEIQTLRAEVSEARQWARHGYEIGQRHCGWTDHGVAPGWLTEGWPNSFDSCEHLKRAAELDEALSRVRAESARIRATTRTWEPVADLIDAALNGTREGDGDTSTGRPKHPDGTPYRYHEIVAEGWHHCDGCRTWGQWTAEKPHDCPASIAAHTPDA